MIAVLFSATKCSPTRYMIPLKGDMRKRLAIPICSDEVCNFEDERNIHYTYCNIFDTTPFNILGLPEGHPPRSG